MSAAASAAGGSTRLSGASAGVHGPARIASASSLAADGWSGVASTRPSRSWACRSASVSALWCLRPGRGGRRAVGLGAGGWWGFALGVNGVQAQPAPFLVGDRCNDLFRAGEVADASGFPGYAEQGWRLTAADGDGAGRPLGQIEFASGRGQPSYLRQGVGPPVLSNDRQSNRDGTFRLSGRGESAADVDQEIGRAHV